MTASHLDPSWLASFTSNHDEHKRAMLHSLVNDWLHQHPPGVDHALAAMELLAHGHARRDLLESTIAEGLVGAFAVPSLQGSAASCTARFLQLYPPGGQLLAERLKTAIQHDARYIEGVERLAGVSRAARLTVCPALYEAAIANLTAARPGFLAVAQAFDNVGRLKCLLEVSPYAAELDGAFGVGAE